MRDRVRLMLPGLVVLVAAAMPGGAPLASAPTSPLQSMRDFSGVWLNDTATPLERPAQFGQRNTFTETEARAYEKKYQVEALKAAVIREQAFEVDAAAGDIDTYVPGPVLPDLRNSLIVDPPDGRIPPLTLEGRQRAQDRRTHLEQHYADNPEDLLNGERCLTVANTAVPPLLPMFYNSLVQIVQTGDDIAIVSEMVHDARIVSTHARPHLPSHLTQWKGDSVGHWENDTFVVDTTNFSSKTSFRGSGLSLHVVERFTRTNPDRLRYRFTIDDADVFTRPWSAESVWRRSPDRMYEYACHEANYSMFNILRGARFSEVKAPK